jgi:ketosteroid isomerase-like protein
MQEAQNTKVVQDAYAAFGRGDIPTLLGLMTTGRTFESDFVMVFALQRGQIASFQEFTDSAALNASFAISAGV